MQPFGKALIKTLLFPLLPLQVEITLQDINDNPPVFPNDILDVTIEENVGDGFKIMQLTATDADEVMATQLFFPEQYFSRNNWKLEGRKARVPSFNQYDAWLM